uniref:Mediator of DNA damage checkpoint protein 1 n=1 Tax=Mastacembelus armatus TaxID=205130 RepID=A0A7N8WND1_9TELE
EMDATQKISDSILESDEEENEGNENTKGKPLAKLCVLKNQHIPETELPLFLGDNVLGRDPNTCTLSLPAPSISRQHATICISVYRRKGCHGEVDIEALVWDRGTMNGTCKGHLKLTPNVRYALSDGDSLVLADIPCQYVSCAVNTVSSQGDTRTPVSGHSGIKATLPDASGEKASDTSTGSKECANSGINVRILLHVFCLPDPASPPINIIVASSCSDSEEQEDFVVAETQSFILQRRHNQSDPSEDHTMDPTQPLVLESSSDEKEQSSSSYLQCQAQALAIECTQMFASVGECVNPGDAQTSAKMDSNLKTAQSNEEPARHAVMSEKDGQVDLTLEATQAYILEPTGDSVDETDEDEGKHTTSETQPLDLPTSSTMVMAETQPLPAFEKDENLTLDKSVFSVVQKLFSGALYIAETQPMQICDDEESDDEDSISGPRKANGNPLQLEEGQTHPFATSALSVVETQPMQIGLPETQPMATSGNEDSDSEDSVPGLRKRNAKQLRLKQEKTQMPTNSEGSPFETQPVDTVGDGESDEEDSLPVVRKKRKAKPLQLEEETQPLIGSQVSVAETQPMGACEEELNDEDDLIPGPPKRKAKPLQLNEEETQPLSNSEISTGDPQPVETKTGVQPKRGRGRRSVTGTSGISVRNQRGARGRSRRLGEEVDVANPRQQEVTEEREADKREREESEIERQQQKEEQVILERERIKREEKRLEKERTEKEKQERLQAQNAERIRSEQEKAEKERKQKEEKERSDQIKKEKEQLRERKNKEKERLAHENAERQEKERLKRMEKERMEKEEKERLEAEKRKLEERLEREQKEQEHQARLEKEAKEKAEKKRLEKEKKAEEKQIKEPEEKKPTVATRARRTRSRSNSSNSVSSERSASSISTQESKGRGQGRGVRRTSKPPQAAISRSCNSRRTVALTTEQDSNDISPQRVLLRSNSSNSINSEISSCSVSSRGGGRKTQPEPDFIPPVDSQMHQASAPKPAARGQKSRNIGRPLNELSQEKEKADFQQARATRGRQQARANASEPAAPHEEDQLTQKKGHTSEESPQPKRSRGRVCLSFPQVLFTGVVDETGERVLAHLGGSMAEGVADMNCLVTDKVRRTVKFLCAVAKGVPIVTTQWLEKSGKAGNFLSTNAFVVKDPEQENKFSFCLQESLRAASSHPLLQGYKIHVTKSVKPEPVQMKDIISCSGGTFLPKMPSSQKPQTIVVSCKEDWPLCGPAVSASLPVVTAEFILTGILQQKLDFQAHALPQPPTPLRLRPNLLSPGMRNDIGT